MSRLSLFGGNREGKQSCKSECSVKNCLLLLFLLLSFSLSGIRFFFSLATVVVLLSLEQLLSFLCFPVCSGLLYFRWEFFSLYLFNLKGNDWSVFPVCAHCPAEDLPG